MVDSYVPLGTLKVFLPLGLGRNSTSHIPLGPMPKPWVPSLLVSARIEAGEKEHSDRQKEAHELSFCSLALAPFTIPPSSEATWFSTSPCGGAFDGSVVLGDCLEGSYIFLHSNRQVDKLDR